MEILVIKSQYSTSILDWYIVISMLCEELEQFVDLNDNYNDDDDDDDDAMRWRPDSGMMMWWRDATMMWCDVGTDGRVVWLWLTVYSRIL